MGLWGIREDNMNFDKQQLENILLDIIKSLLKKEETR